MQVLLNNNLQFYSIIMVTVFVLYFHSNSIFLNNGELDFDLFQFFTVAAGTNTNLKCVALYIVVIVSHLW